MGFSCQEIGRYHYEWIDLFIHLPYFYLMVSKRDIFDDATKRIFRNISGLNINLRLRYSQESINHFKNKFNGFMNNMSKSIGKTMHNVIMNAYGEMNKYGFVSRKPETEDYYKRYADPYIPQAMRFSGHAERALKQFAEGDGQGDVSANVVVSNVIQFRDSVLIEGQSTVCVGIEYLAMWDKSGSRPVKWATIGEIVANHKNIIAKAWDE